MKLKIKYSNTQKFIVNLSENSFGELQKEIKKFVENSFAEEIREPLRLSLNGVDLITGSDDTQLAELGIVAGDLLIIVAAEIDRSGHQQPVEKPTSSSTNKHKNTKNLVEIPVKEKSIQVTHQSMDASNEDTVPGAAQQLLDTCSPSTASQALNLLIDLIVHKSGFVIRGENIQAGAQASAVGLVNIPPKWQDSVVTWQYNHQSLPDFSCTLVIVTMGKIKQVLASFPEQDQEINYKLDIDDYVKSASGQAITIGDIRFSQLTRTIRDGVLYPLQLAAHRALGIPSPFHLAGLPFELLLHIGSYLSAQAVLRLGQTCHHLHSAMNMNKLWEQLYCHRFHERFKNIKIKNGVNWKEKFVDAVKEMKALEKMQRIPQENPYYLYDPYSQHAPPHQPANNSYPSGPGTPWGDPDSPYFQGEIPGGLPGIPTGDPYGNNPYGPLHNPNPLGMPDPFGMRPRRPRNEPFLPGGYMHPRPGLPRGPNFDFF